MRRRQQGMTFIGLLFILAMAGALLYAGIRLAPAYLNYMKIVRTMEAAAADSKGENPDLGAIRHSLERHWEIEDPEIIDYKDVEVVKNESAVQLHVMYDHPVPYIANVSLSVHFDKTVTVQ